MNFNELGYKILQTSRSISISREIIKFTKILFVKNIFPFPNFQIQLKEELCVHSPRNVPKSNKPTVFQQYPLHILCFSGILKQRIKFVKSILLELVKFLSLPDNSSTLALFATTPCEGHLKAKNGSFPVGQVGVHNSRLVQYRLSRLLRSVSFR